MNGQDWFTRAFGGAVDDIRKKLIEEPWFGRAVTPPYRQPQTIAEEMGWDKANPSSDHDQSNLDNGHDFER